MSYGFIVIHILFHICHRCETFNFRSYFSFTLTLGSEIMASFRVCVDDIVEVAGLDHGCLAVIRILIKRLEWKVRGLFLWLKCGGKISYVLDFAKTLIHSGYSNLFIFYEGNLFSTFRISTLNQ